MKLKPLLCVLALLVTFLCVCRVAAGWLPGEEAMLQVMKRSSLTTKVATAAVEHQQPTAEPSQTSLQPQQHKIAAQSSTGVTRVKTPKPGVSATNTSSQAQANLSACSGIAASQSSLTSSTSLEGAPEAGDHSFVVSQYRPREEVHLAHPSNYGDRFSTDVYGRPVNNEFIVVLHETVYSASSALNYFQTPHVKDDDQASYHTLIQRDGTVIYVVPPEKRAFGAGNSVFMSARGAEAVKTKRELPPSVNNFAYHVSLESPSDGSDTERYHSGYTDAQYQSLAWLLAKTSIPDQRITTHRLVDRSGTRTDPRSFDQGKFFSLLRSYPRRIRISGVEQCIPPAVAQQPTEHLNLN